MMLNVRFVVFFIFICLLVLKINPALVSAQDAVSMVKDIKGEVWLITDKSKEKIKVEPMQELNVGDKLEIGNGGGATLLYYYSEIEEKCLENSVIEIGRKKGIIHKGKVESIEDSGGSGFIRIESDLPSSLRSQESFGAFTLRGNPPPSPSKYFDEANIKRYAVVIGISKFKDPKIPALKYADRDAQSFYDYLISPAAGSFSPDNVLLLKNENATLKNVKDALTNFLKKAVEEDFVVVYIATHGEPEPDRPKNLFLLTHDSELEKLASTAYHMENVNLDMKRYISSERLIFFADACHAGGIASGGFSTRGFSNPINNALAALSTTKEGWAMITASRASEVSLESDKWGNGHGAFTYFLLEGLNGRADIAGNYNGIVTIAEAFDYLENRVRRVTQNAQHPVITGDFDNNLPIGFLPIVAQKGTSDSSKDSASKEQVEFKGTLSITSTEDNANIFINKKFVGKISSNEPFVKKIPAGSAKLSVKKKGLPDYERVVYINPNETTNVYVAMRSVPRSAQTTEETIFAKQTSPAVNGNVSKDKYVEPQVDEAALKSGIDKMIKELEEMRLKQIAAQGVVEKPKAEKEKRIEKIEQPKGIPVSIKRFVTNMKAGSEQRDMDVLRMRVIDELIKESGISIVERDLQYQETILREQRLGGSILADKMFRIELGRIMGADFICFSRVFTAYDTDDLILRLEIVETATTLVETIELNFKSKDISLANAKNIASKIKEKIAKKRKL
ncbi:MAG: caspase family protein [Candidatus Anammoxibacter sp.]